VSGNFVNPASPFAERESVDLCNRAKVPTDHPVEQWYQ
jgi:hypothetical protein